MTSTFLYSQRLLFVASTPTLLQAELMGPHHLAQLLNVALPADWPPGEYDRDAMQFFLNQLQAGGQAAAGWYGWYIICYPTGNDSATLVACGGYFGPPDRTGTVEIGYSVSVDWQMKGIATELVSTLIDHAWRQEGVQRIIAHTAADNQASINVLTKNGFYPVESNDAETLQFELVTNR